MENPGCNLFCGFWVIIFVLEPVKPMVYEGKEAFHCEDNRFSIGSLFRAENVALLGHVRKSVWTSTLIHCNQLCLAQPDWCISVNFNGTKVDQKKGKHLCELNSRGVKTEDELFGNNFGSRRGFIFNQIRPLKYGCPCKYGGSCDYNCATFEVKCLCAEGFYGSNCEHIDDCQGIVCQNGGSCQDLVNNFTCSCVPGYTGRLCHVDINDCQGIVCQNGGSCQDLVNNFTCFCVAGYTGRFCETDIDDCQGITCQNGGSCQDLVNNFTCSCVAGYTGRFCETDIDDCHGITCQNGGSCQDLVNNFTCSCVAGYTGRFCGTGIDDCQGITCQNGGSCQDLVNDFTCSCVAGYTGRFCGTDIDDCHGITCQNGGSCQDLVNNFTCSCVAGYTGRFCETDIDDCHGITCRNGGSCQDLVNNFTCSCVAGYTGRFCDTGIDDCQGITCQNGGSCQDLVNDFTCSCVAGYTGRFCGTDIDDCQGITCQNGGSCQDLVNNFTCSCVVGYTGRFCETDVDECASNPCLNGGTCLNKVNHFLCTCPQTHHGTTCNKLSTCDISYPSYSINNVIYYPWTVAASAMTFCSWVKLTDSRDQYPASLTYFSRGLGFIYRADGRIFIRIDSSGTSLKMGIKRDGNWQHLCIAWRSTDGKVSSYRNGQLAETRPGFNTGKSIVGSGSLNICRRSDRRAAFIGSISNFNIWSSFLSANQIASMGLSCQPLSNEGNIVKWSEVKSKVRYGAVTKACPGTCYV